MTLATTIGLFGMASVLAATAAMTTAVSSDQSGTGRNPDARVTSVTTNGSAKSYTFVVTIRSNDTGMDHYADWWEVVDEHGALLYRRVLLHDHADEQPFARDGGPVPIGADQVVTVRAHVYPSGYSSAAMRGSVASGFKPVELPSNFAPGLERQPPQPDRD
jgi:hypothetical protein